MKQTLQEWNFHKSSKHQDTIIAIDQISAEIQAIVRKLLSDSIHDCDADKGKPQCFGNRTRKEMM